MRLSYRSLSLAIRMTFSSYRSQYIQKAKVQGHSSVSRSDVIALILAALVLFVVYHSLAIHLLLDISALQKVHIKWSQHIGSGIQTFGLLFNSLSTSGVDLETYCHTQPYSLAFETHVFFPRSGTSLVSRVSHALLSFDHTSYLAGAYGSQKSILNINVTQKSS